MALEDENESSANKRYPRYQNGTASQHQAKSLGSKPTPDSPYECLAEKCDGP